MELVKAHHKIDNIPYEIYNIVYNKVDFEIFRPHGVVALSLHIHVHRPILLYERSVAWEANK